MTLFHRRRRLPCFSLVAVWSLLLLFAVGRLNNKSAAVVVAADVEEHEDSASSSCPQHCLEAMQQQSTMSNRREQEPSSSMSRIAFLIVVHDERTLNDAVHLFRAIRHQRNLILIHVDIKAKQLTQESALQSEINDCACGSTVVIESIYDVKWSHWSMNLPTLWGLQTAIRNYTNDAWDVFINLSGDTYPVYGVDALATILHELPYNIVTSSSCETGLIPTSLYQFPKWWHKRQHYTQSGTEEDPQFTHTVGDNEKTTTTIMTTYFGSQWMILQRDFCQWLVDQLDIADSLPSLYRDHLMASNKLMTDETYFSSLIMHTHWNATLPRTDKAGFLLWRNGSASNIIDVRYERMDEHVPSAFGYFPTDQRMQVPESKVQLLGKGHPWGPYFLGTYDLAAIKHSGALFVRKVSQYVDHNLIHLLGVNTIEELPSIDWPDEIAVSPKPDWERTKAELLRADRESAAEQDATAQDGNDDADVNVDEEEEL